MTKRTRFILITLTAFVICTGLIFLTAYGIGADPLHPRSRHIWLLSLVAALYASVRLAMIAEKLMHWQAGDEDGKPRLAGFGFLKKKEHAIDRRMAARRERVEAAQATAETAEDSTE